MRKHTNHHHTYTLLSVIDGHIGETPSHYFRTLEHREANCFVT